jgi:hypothetical protein
VLWENWTFRRAYRRRGLAACREIYERYYRRPWPYAGSADHSRGHKGRQ